MIIDCQGLTKKFGAFTALNDLSFKVKAGECFGLLGPNGAGKSTLINILYGAMSRTSGDLKVFALDPANDSRKIKLKTGVVTQEDALDDAMGTEENLQVFGRFYGLDQKQRQTRIAHLLEFLNLAAKAKSPIRALSGGMKRRLVLARALLNEPQLLILDEPTTGLDPAVRHLLWDKITELKKQGVTILLTTHYMDEAQRLCDRLVIMDQGQIRAEGAPQALISQMVPGGNLEDVFLKVTGRDLKGDA